MKTVNVKSLLVALGCTLLVACSADHQDPQPMPPVDEPVVEPTVVSGVAATGAALDGATVEVIDASGNTLDVGDVLTGSDGAYEVTLPDNVAMPVIVRVTPAGGTPLLNIVQAPEDGSTEVTANINPITNLVSSAVLGGADSTDAAALAGALATTDVTTIESTGDEIVERLLGSTISYRSFAADPDFVARAQGSEAPSPADAILDAVARQASNAGATLEDQLASLNAQSDPPRLLEAPDFQIGLVAEMIKGGTASADIEARLVSVGAIGAAAEGQPDVFRTIISTVPTLIEAVQSGSTAVESDADLLEVAVDAAVDLLAGTVKEKADRFAANDDALVAAIASPSLSQTVTSVVQSSVLPVLSSFVGSGITATVKNNLLTVTNQVVKQAVVVASAFQYSQSSTDVSDLVSAFVAQQVTPPTSEQDLAAAATGQSGAVQDVGDVNAAKTSIETFAADNSDLVDGELEDLVEEIPPGSWGTSRWDGFNWG